MNKQETDKHALDIAILGSVILILLCALAIITIYSKKAQKDAVHKVNQQWVHELTKRGFMSLNDAGGSCNE